VIESTGAGDLVHVLMLLWLLKAVGVGEECTPFHQRPDLEKSKMEVVSVRLARWCLFSPTVRKIVVESALRRTSGLLYYLAAVFPGSGLNQLAHLPEDGSIEGKRYENFVDSIGRG
jgi:hypothetical protein